MQAKALNPILNVSSMVDSFAWFEKLGWKESWASDDPPTFGGVWISIWVGDVDAEYRNCTTQGLEVMWRPTDHPWGVREMHVRHPDGHIFRISQSLAKKP
jgi:hypothetical protein